MSTLAFVGLIIGAMMVGAILGTAALALFIGSRDSDGPAEPGTDFDASITEWGYIGERRGEGQL